MRAVGIKLSGHAPVERLNGLLVDEERWESEQAPAPKIAIVLVERSSLTWSDSKQETSATLQFRQIEPLEGDLADDAKQLLEQAFSARTGEATLPVAIDEPELDLDTPLEDQGDNVTSGPWEPDGDDEDGEPA